MDKSLKAACIGEFLEYRITYLLWCRLCRGIKSRGSKLWTVGNQYHVGLGVAIAVYASAGLSGAHLNPAVTIALWQFACFDGKKSFLTS